LSGLAAAALIIFNRGSFLAPSNRIVTGRDYCEASLNWIQLASQGLWSNVNDDAQIVPKGNRWQQIRADEGLVDCFMSFLSDGTRVYRFELRGRAATGVPDSFSSTPHWAGGTYACSARREGQTIVVIAVEGDVNAYRQAIAAAEGEARMEATMNTAA
jgi:hypothetical protein